MESGRQGRLVSRRRSFEGEELMTITDLDLRASPHRVAPGSSGASLPHPAVPAWPEPGHSGLEARLAARATAGASP